MKRSVVALVLLIILAFGIFMALSYSTKSLEFSVLEIGQVGASEMDISIDACNPSVLPVSVEGIEAVLHGSSGDYGTIAAGSKYIPPLSEETMQGTLDFADFNSMKNVVDWVLNNESSADFNATILVKSKIMGVIPYSYEKNYDLTEFSDILFGNHPWSCKQNHANDVKQQLSLAQVRMSAASLIYSGKIGIGNSTQHNDINSSEYGSSG